MTDFSVGYVHCEPLLNEYCIYTSKTQNLNISIELHILGQLELANSFRLKYFT